MSRPFGGVPGPAALRVVGRVVADVLATELVLQLRCPGCGRWGDIDDDQLHGRVSVDHSDAPGCTYHETHDFAAEAIWMENDTSRMCGWGPWAGHIGSTAGGDDDR